MNGRITSFAELESVIGRAPPAIELKVIDHLDETALRLIAVPPLAFLAVGQRAGTAVTLGPRGFAGAEAKRLALSLDLLDDPGLFHPGAPFGSLFLAPGVGETLRVNGRFAEVRDNTTWIAVEECYVYCAKALIRSEFWSAEVQEPPAEEPQAFVAVSHSMALATLDALGRADLSPKGDPAGCIARHRNRKPDIPAVLPWARTLPSSPSILPSLLTRA